jgi:ATPase domain predominantly from Archaea
MPDGAPKELGLLFPAGGRVSPEQMIDREGEVADLVQRLSEFLHVTVSGPRRIGKTSVCGALCARLSEVHGFLVIEVEAPEESSASGFCQLLIDRCARLDLTRLSRGVLRAAVPALQEILADQGLPLDLSEFGAEVPPATRRKAIELPLTIARQQTTKVVLFIDELQRACGNPDGGYADGVGLVSDLVDAYAGNTDVVVLVDGSDERTIDKLMAEPYGMARLSQRVPLAERIPFDQWQRPLRTRFEQAGLPIADDDLERILEFGEGRPYDTMSACLYVAYNARRLDLPSIDTFSLEQGLAEARARLDEDA